MSLFIVQIFALLMIVSAFCGLWYKINRVTVICKGLQTSKTDKRISQKLSQPKNVYFCISVSVSSSSVLETYTKPCYFYQAKFFEIPLSQPADVLFIPHQLSIHLHLEAMHHWKHLTGKSQLPFLPSTQTHSLKATCEIFPQIDN